MDGGSYDLKPGLHESRRDNWGSIGVVYVEVWIALDLVVLSRQALELLQRQK